MTAPEATSNRPNQLVSAREMLLILFAVVLLVSATHTRQDEPAGPVRVKSEPVQTHGVRAALDLPAATNLPSILDLPATV